MDLPHKQNRQDSDLPGLPGGDAAQVKATPARAELAADRGVNETKVRGSGTRHGRIEETSERRRRRRSHPLRSRRRKARRRGEEKAQAPAAAPAPAPTAAARYPVEHVLVRDRREAVERGVPRHSALLPDHRDRHDRSRAPEGRA